MFCIENKRFSCQTALFIFFLSISQACRIEEDEKGDGRRMNRVPDTK